MKGKIMNIQNSMCDGDHCTSANGEVRVLPSGGDSNLILCRQCYLYEIQFRLERNRKLSRECRFKLPAWDDLKVYKNG
jgi:hypothetical protein